MHTTKDIADRLEVNAQTIRRWSQQFADHLSDGARNKDALQFTDDDLLTLWSIRRWRQLGYSLDEIGSRLTSGQRVSEDLPDAADQDGPDRRAIMIPEAQFTGALAEIRRLEGERERLLIERDRAIDQRETDRQVMTDRITALEREIGALQGKLTVIEADRQPASYWLTRIAVAVLFTVIAVAVIAGVILLLIPRA